MDVSAGGPRPGLRRPGGGGGGSAARGRRRATAVPGDPVRAREAAVAQRQPVVSEAVLPRPPPGPAHGQRAHGCPPLPRTRVPGPLPDRLCRRLHRKGLSPSPLPVGSRLSGSHARRCLARTGGAGLQPGHPRPGQLRGGPGAGGRHAVGARSRRGLLGAQRVLRHRRRRQPLESREQPPPPHADGWARSLDAERCARTRARNEGHRRRPDPGDGRARFGAPGGPAPAVGPGLSRRQSLPHDRGLSARAGPRHPVHRRFQRRRLRARWLRRPGPAGQAAIHLADRAGVGRRGAAPGCRRPRGGRRGAGPARGRRSPGRRQRLAAVPEGAGPGAARPRR